VAQTRRTSPRSIDALICSRGSQPAVRAALNERGETARVKGAGLIWKDRAKGFGDPFCRRAILAEDYRAVDLQPPAVAQVMQDNLDFGIDVRTIRHRHEISFDFT
jgi:hypothetical protein